MLASESFSGHRVLTRFDSKRLPHGVWVIHCTCEFHEEHCFLERVPCDTVWSSVLFLTLLRFRSPFEREGELVERSFVEELPSCRVEVSQFRDDCADDEMVSCDAVLCELRALALEVSECLPGAVFAPLALPVRVFTDTVEIRVNREYPAHHLLPATLLLSGPGALPPRECIQVMPPALLEKEGATHGVSEAGCSCHLHV